MCVGLPGVILIPSRVRRDESWKGTEGGVVLPFISGVLPGVPVWTGPR